MPEMVPPNRLPLTLIRALPMEVIGNSPLASNDGSITTSVTLPVAMIPELPMLAEIVAENSMIKLVGLVLKSGHERVTEAALDGKPSKEPPPSCASASA